MWLKSLIQSSDLQYLSREERRSVLENTVLSWIRTIDNFSVNKKIINLLNPWNKSEQIILKDILRTSWWIWSMKDWEFSVSDIWDNLGIKGITYDYISQEYFLYDYWLSSKLNFDKILDPNNISNLVDVKFVENVFGCATCRDTDSYNNQILNEPNNTDVPYFLIEINWKIIWHIKLKWEKTFLSYVNAKDSNWNISLIKWWIYSVSRRYEQILKVNRIDEFNIHNYILTLDSLLIDFERISKFWYFSEKLESHLKRIWKRRNIYIEDICIE